MGFFFRRSRAANSVVHGRILPNFELIQALMYMYMYIIVTCKYGSDQKRSRKRDDAVFPIVTLSVAMETSREFHNKVSPNVTKYANFQTSYNG